MPAATPRTVKRWCTRVCAVSTPLAAAALVLWVIGPDWLPESGATDRLLFAAYHVLLLVSLSSAVVLLVAASQVAIAQAFTAGYNTGLAVSQAAQQPDGDGTNGRHTRTRRPVPLRIVE